MMMIHAKSYRLSFRKSGSHRTITSAPIVVSSAARMAMKALRLW